MLLCFLHSSTDRNSSDRVLNCYENAHKILENAIGEHCGLAKSHRNAILTWAGGASELLLQTTLIFRC